MSLQERLETTERLTHVYLKQDSIDKEMRERSAKIVMDSADLTDNVQKTAGGLRTKIGKILEFSVPAANRPLP